MATEDVHIGKDGWLFLKGGRNCVLDYYTTPTAFSSQTAENWGSLLRSRADRAAEIGARYVHLLVPEKLTVYPEFFDGELPFYNSCPALQVARSAASKNLDKVVVQTLDYMRRLKQDYLLYWKTDTHWTFHGCFAAYQMLCSYLDVPQNRSLIESQRTYGNIVLDLGTKVDPPIREQFATTNFIRNARLIHTNPIVNYKRANGLENEVGLHSGSHVIFVNHTPGVVPSRVVLFGDSFSEYRPHLLTGMLAETFYELHYIWSTSIDWSYVERVRPNILITEAAERFMRNVPSDNFDLDAYVVRTMAPILG